MHCKRPSMKDFAVTATSLAAGGWGAHWCWLYALGVVVAALAIGLGNAAHASAPPDTQRTLTGRVQGMQGEARVVISGGGPDCTVQPGGGFVAPPSSQPQGVRMPYGVLAFHALGCHGSITVALTYPEALPPRAQLWKLGPAEQGATEATWFAWRGAQFSADRRTVTYTVEDNGVGDSDPQRGRILDPATVALVPSVALPTPQDNSWALWAAAAIFGLMVWLDGRSRPRSAA